jgi:hypothetical protein
MKYGEHKAILWGKLVTTAEPIKEKSCLGCVNASSALGACFEDMCNGKSQQTAAGFVECYEAGDHIYVEVNSEQPAVAQQVDPYAHYFKDVRQLDAIDVYRVIELFEVTDPCIQHAVKKLLCAGSRGQKDMAKDITEASDSLARWHEMREEDALKEPK